MKKIWYLLFFWFIAGAFVQINTGSQSNSVSEDIWLPSASGNIANEPQVILKTGNDLSYEITVTFSGVWASTISNGTDTFTSLYLEGYGHAGTPGIPDLPVFTTQLQIPAGASVSLKILDIKTGKIKLSDKNLPEKIIPVQQPVPKSGPQPPWVSPDEQVYSQNQTFPELPAIILPAYTMRAHTLQPIQVYPVQYLPSSGELLLVQQISFQVILDTTGSPKTDSNPQLSDPEFDALVNKSVLNPLQSSNPIADSKDETGSGYLIITPDTFISTLQPLVDLKSFEGYKVTVASLTDIGGSSTTAIKTFIQNAYNNWSTPPVYILLVGDTNYIPAWKSDAYEIRNTKGTDLYYATMDGSTDFVPDILLGRLPARDTLQLTGMINKIVSYALEDGTESWVKKAAFIATCDATYFPIAENTHNSVITNHTIPENFTGNFPSINLAGGDQLYCRTNSALKADIVTAINDQQGLLTYSGHGSTLSWSDFSFYQSTVRELNDNQVYPLVASFACETNDFANTTFVEVFGETWMLQPEKGAVTFIGSVDYSYWNQDDQLERSMYDHLFSNPSDPPTISSALHYGLERVQVNYSGNSKYYWETYNILGDPSTRIWVGPRTPDFRMSSESSEISVCSANQTNTSIDITSINNFSDEVALSTQNLPSFVSSWLTPATLNPTASSELTIDAAGDSIPGEYPFIVQGTSGAITHDIQLSLTINSSIPDTITLMQPLDNSTTTSLTPTLQWQPINQSFHYQLQVATDFTFTNLVIDQQDLINTSFTPLVPLESNGVYFWRVRAINACGPSSYSTIFRFETTSGAGDCRSPELTQVLYQNDFENDISDWAIVSQTGSYTWNWDVNRSLSPLHSFYALTPGIVSEQSIISDPLLIPLDSQNSSLRFWQWRDIEDSSSGCLDGGVLDYSVNGTSWSQVPAEWILSGPPRYLISTFLVTKNPLDGLYGWCGSGDWEKTTIDISSLQGETVQFRFRVGTDDSISREGWYIDDFRLQTCQLTYRFSTESLLTEQEQLSGLSATYPITITNNGDLDTYLVEIENNLWNTEFSILPEIDYLEMATLFITVNVPPGLATGEFDEATVTITSNNDPTQFEQITLTTSAIENHPVFIPSIMK